MNRYILFFFGFLLLASCVSSKKFHVLEGTLATKEMEIKTNHIQIDSLEKAMSQLAYQQQILEKELAHQQEKVSMLNRELTGKSSHITDLQNELDEVKQENLSYASKNESLSHAQSVYAGITRTLISELEMQQLKVMNLTLAMERMDSLNIHLVKKSKKELSDKKYKKALEKLGFVFQ